LLTGNSGTRIGNGAAAAAAAAAVGAACPHVGHTHWQSLLSALDMGALVPGEKYRQGAHDQPGVSHGVREQGVGRCGRECMLCETAGLAYRQ
jgi:hypothetical protein